MRRHIILALVSLFAGGLGLYLLVTGAYAFAGACHLLSAFCGEQAAVLSDSRRLGGHSFQTAMSRYLPFFGGATAFVLSEAVKRKKTGELSDEFAVYLNDAASFRESVPVYDSEMQPSDEIVPLADILANPVSEAEQRIAVENLASMETPEAMDILRKVIDLDSSEGRFFAMTALGQMEEKLLLKLQRLEEDLSSGRDESTNTLVETARTYLDFSYYQLAQDARRGEYLTRAAELLEQALAHPDCDPVAWILLGRIRMLQADAVAALACFNTYLETNRDNQAALLWRAEAWYLMGNYAEVKADCLRVRDQGEAPPSMRDTVDFWLNGNRAAHG